MEEGGPVRTDDHEGGLKDTLWKATDKSPWGPRTPSHGKDVILGLVFLEVRVRRVRRATAPVAADLAGEGFREDQIESRS
ncbi:MAG: hypothetical protein NVV66_00205 [Cellulomonas sp.]|uniref:hypothetical protein n=1 Tax=Cellulomonas sp. TaxID=40001 RepID=UPI002587AE9B|nr:hypothetical protein [Cellulomonas sp.]MCR6703176.1 hypothetical protein [Cellulomonas sp.]